MRRAGNHAILPVWTSSPSKETMSRNEGAKPGRRDITVAKGRKDFQKDTSKELVPQSNKNDKTQNVYLYTTMT